MWELEPVVELEREQEQEQGPVWVAVLDWELEPESESVKELEQVQELVAAVLVAVLGTVRVPVEV